MAKRRDLTTGEAHAIALMVIMTAVDEAEIGTAFKEEPYVSISDFEKYLSKKWFDGETSKQSWVRASDSVLEHVSMIMDAFRKEVKEVTGQEAVPTNI